MTYITQKTPLTYICIINWNDYTNTSECLNSIQRIDYPNYRVLLIDNGSEDGSGHELKKDYPWVELLENKKNLGFAGGNNVGIRYAIHQGAEYIFLLNNDTVVDPQVLETLIDVAASDDRIGIVGPATYCYSHRDVFWSAGMEKVVPNGKIFPHFVMRGCGEVDQGQYRCIEDVDMINACAMLIKRRVIEEVGLLDEKFFAYNEDSDWNDRVASAGYRIVYVPEARIWHKGSVSLGGVNSPASWFYTVRNELFFFKKRAAWLGLPRLLRLCSRELLVMEGFQGQRRRQDSPERSRRHMVRDHKQRRNTFHRCAWLV